MSSRDLVLVSPATVVDLADVFGSGDYGLWVAAKRQVAAGPSYAIRAVSGAVVIGGFVRDGDWWEAWFWAAPSAARHMLAIVRSVRLTLRDRGDDRIYAVIRSDAGRRIACALGFRAFRIVNGREVWTHG